MRTIRIGFSRARSKWAIFSSLLQWYMRKDYSHVYVEIEESGLPMVYQASKSMVHSVPMFRFLEQNEVVMEYEFEVDDDTYAALLTAHKHKLGLKYDYLQLVGIWWATAFNLSGNPLRSSQLSYICSELTAYTLMNLGYSVDYSLDLVRPDDIESIIESGRN